MKEIKIIDGWSAVEFTNRLTVELNYGWNICDVQPGVVPGNVNGETAGHFYIMIERTPGAGNKKNNKKEF